jgi:hypothetical protein
MKISAVLPYRTTGHHFAQNPERSEILFRSLDRFASPGLFGRILIVTPADEVPSARRHFRAWSHLGAEVVDENELEPGLLRNKAARGWRKQQILKLAAARAADTPFTLTLDPDVICTKPLDYSRLVVDRKALLQPLTKRDRAHWWRASAAVLGVDPRLDRPGMHVTPALLSRRLCQNLIEKLSTLSRRSWVDYLLGLQNRWRVWNLLPSEQRKRKWTEYSLYYLSALEDGLLMEEHVVAGTEAVPQTLVSEQCVWSTTPFDSWDAGFCFSAADPSFFSIVQSNSGIDPARIWDRVKPYIESGGPDPGAARRDPPAPDPRRHDRAQS